jgi:hypothetical protein
MAMPDTYYLGEQPYEYLAQSSAAMDLACWPIRPEQAGKLGQVLISDKPAGEVTDSRDKDPACIFEHSWGAMSFDRISISQATADMPHTGYIIPKLLSEGIPVRARIMDGQYFDCGTPREYLKMLELVT